MSFWWFMAGAGVLMLVAAAVETFVQWRQDRAVRRSGEAGTPIEAPAGGASREGREGME
jgi:hypothetical protein